MHELALLQSLVATVEKNVRAERVLVVRLEVGELAGVMATALSAGFEVCTRGTRLEGARLEIASIPGRGICRSCGSETRLAYGVGACGCGSLDVEIVSGRELRIKNVEVQ